MHHILAVQSLRQSVRKNDTYQQNIIFMSEQFYDSELFKK